MTVPIIPSTGPFLEGEGSDVFTAYDVGALYILNGNEWHRPLVDETTDRYHLMFSLFGEDMEIAV